MADGFIGRWSKRKLDAKEGKPVQAEPVEPAASVPHTEPVAQTVAIAQTEPVVQTVAIAQTEPVVSTGPVAQTDGGKHGAAVPGDAAPAEAAPLTLEDVRALTRDSDFSRFTAPDVAPEVKNAALKKLFSDPHYNVMDGLDVYIDDYSKPDPIPAAMLRQLVSAKFLKLFDEEQKEQAPAASGARDVAHDPTGQSVAQSEPIPPAGPEVHDDADPYLRLQPDHAAPGEDPGDGAQ